MNLYKIKYYYYYILLFSSLEYLEHLSQHLSQHPDQKSTSICAVHHVFPTSSAADLPSVDVCLLHEYASVEPCIPVSPIPEH